MTSGVEQTLPRILMPARGSDRNALRDSQSDTGFDEALGRLSKADQKGEAEAPADEKPNWLRFGNRLGATIDRLANRGSRDGVAPEPDIQNDADIELAADDSPDIDKAPDQEMPRKVGRDDPRDDGTAAIEAARDIQPGPENTVKAQQGAAIDADDRDRDRDEKTASSHTMETEGPPSAPQASLTAPAPATAKPDSTLRPAAEPLPSARPRAALTQEKEAETELSADEDGITKGPAREVPAPRTGTVATAAAAPNEQQPATPSPARSAGGAPNDAAEEPDAKPSHSLRDPIGVETRVKVMSEQNLPAPAQSTTVALANTLAASGALKFVPVRPTSDIAQAPVQAGPVHSLSLQLHPAELGMVTASMKFAGSQLTIEIQVENADAYRTLTADTETLVKSLKGLGYDVDRVTVLQPAANNATQARTDAGTSEAARQGSGQPGAGASGNGNGGAGGQQTGANGSNARQGGQASPVVHQDRTGGGVYI